MNIANRIPMIAGNMKISPARITKKNPKKRTDFVTSLRPLKNEPCMDSNLFVYIVILQVVV